MTTKTVRFNRSGIGRLPDSKPAAYRIQTESRKTNYAGIAKRGRVQERLAEDLPGGKDHVPRAKVQIEQQRSIDRAQAKEARVIARVRSVRGRRPMLTIPAAQA